MSTVTLFFSKGTAPSKWAARYAEWVGGSVELLERDDAFAALAEHVAGREQNAVAAASTASVGEAMATDQAAHGEQNVRASVALEHVMALTRLPDERIDDTYHVVRLYEEQPGVVVPADSELSLLEVVTAEDIADQLCNYQPQGRIDVAAVREAVMVVAANVGVALAPRPLLRSLNNKETKNLDYAAGEPTTIALVWRKEDDCDVMQDFVGITKGRRANSSRSVQPAAKATEKQRRRRTSNSTSNRDPKQRQRSSGGGGRAKGKARPAKDGGARRRRG